MNIRTRLIIGSLAVLAIIASGFAYTNLARAPQEAQETHTRSIDVTLTIEGILSSHATVVTEGTTALELLREESKAEGFELSEKTYIGLGTMVEKIGSFTNGTDGKYWTYSVNGKFAAVGADAYELKPDDRIEWTFAVPENY